MPKVQGTRLPAILLGCLAFIGGGIYGVAAGLLRPFRAQPQPQPQRRPSCAVRRPRPVSQEGGHHAQ